MLLLEQVLDLSILQRIRYEMVPGMRKGPHGTGCPNDITHRRGPICFGLLLAACCADLLRRVCRDLILG